MIVSKLDQINFHEKLLDFESHPVLNPVDQFLLFEKLPDKGLSIYYVIRDGGTGVFPIYCNIT